MSRCGYCGRQLVRVPGRKHWECPRCAPLLHDLGRDIDLNHPGGWEAFMHQYRRFCVNADRDLVDR